MTNIPSPRICYRVVDEQYYRRVQEAGYDPLVAKIVASRSVMQTANIDAILSPALKFLDNPQGLPDIEHATERLIQALENHEIIGIETDHDCDGQTSHAVIYTALTTYFGHPPERVRSYIGHRLKEGYGLSEQVMERILADVPRPTLVITADNGSSDEARIAKLQAEGIDVIVTDHHEIPEEGIPASAYAVINPIRSETQYPDRAIAGCMVAWLFMAAVRQRWSIVRQQTFPSLAGLLDFVAVGTIADCVSMAKSQNNRAVVAFGMKLITKAERPCWAVLKPILSEPLSSEDLGFKIGPLLNSDGRLSCAFGSVSFLLSQDEEEAQRWVVHLRAQNQERKAIQEAMLGDVFHQAKEQYAEGRQALCIFLKDGHPGVHGICASRVKEAFGRPVIIFSPKMGDGSLLTGSGRSIDGLHLRQVLQTIADRSPGLIERFGGHQGAAGLSILKENLASFSTLFEEVASERLGNTVLGPTIWVDSFFSISALDYDKIKALLTQLEPFGREFESPLFELHAKVLSLSSLGEKGIHLKLILQTTEGNIEGIWFSAREGMEVPWPVKVGDFIQVIYSPKLQTFRGLSKVVCSISHARLLFEDHDSYSDLIV